MGQTRSAEECKEESVFSENKEEAIMAEVADMEWIAGIFEGEGFVGWSINMSNQEDIHPTFTIANNDLSMLLECQKIIDGKIHYGGGSKRPNAKSLKIETYKGVRQVALSLHPYLRTDYKKKQVENFLARDEQMNEHPYQKRGDNIG